jgi:hypothetical protein
MLCRLPSFTLSGPGLSLFLRKGECFSTAAHDMANIEDDDAMESVRSIKSISPRRK